MECIIIDIIENHTADTFHKFQGRMVTNFAYFILKVLDQ